MDISKIHVGLLELLKEFNQICCDNDIHYTLHGGTLLGAIREHGFIPWDDDADISMTRDEYQKLEKVMQNKKSKLLIRGAVKKQVYSKIDALLWIDIFICDYISTVRIFQKSKLILLTVLDIMSRDKYSMRLSNLSKYSKKKQLAFKAIYYLGKIIPMKWKSAAYNCIAVKWLTGNKSFQFRSNDQYIGRSIIMPSSWMKKYKKVPFEGEMLMVSEDYADILSSSYGSDYMIPIHDKRNSVIHDIVRQQY